MKAYKYSKKLMELEKVFPVFGGSKTPVDGITSLFRMVHLIRITGIAKCAKTNYFYLQPNLT